MLTLICMFGLTLENGKATVKEVKKADVSFMAAADAKRTKATLCRKLFGKKADLAKVEGGDK